MMTRLLYSSVIIATEGRTDTPTKRGSEKAICEAKCDGGRDRARGRGGRETDSRVCQALGIGTSGPTVFLWKGEESRKSGA